MHESMSALTPENVSAMTEIDPAVSWELACAYYRRFLHTRIDMGFDLTVAQQVGSSGLLPRGCVAQISVRNGMILVIDDELKWLPRGNEWPNAVTLEHLFDRRAGFDWVSMIQDCRRVERCAKMLMGETDNEFRLKQLQELIEQAIAVKRLVKWEEYTAPSKPRLYNY
jgi:hypothetical protein